MSIARNEKEKTGIHRRNTEVTEIRNLLDQELFTLLAQRLRGESFAGFPLARERRIRAIQIPFKLRLDPKSMI
jgi:hypothetical protein